MAEAYRADQVGSLLRPSAVLEARAARWAGGLDPEQLRAAEDRAILQALEMQRQAGIDVFSDGEYRRTEFRSVFADAVGGMVELPPRSKPTRPWAVSIRPWLSATRFTGWGA
ncbi:MAG: hypothetical protein ACE5Q6_03880 [Dehalococcoidia bacterium]